MYLCFELDWDARLLLKQDEVPKLALGGGQRLGWTSWLGRRRRRYARRRFVPRCRSRRRRRSTRRMSEISRSALFGKLNSLAYKAIEGATVFCKLRGNPYVELVHWIQQILHDARLRPASDRQAFRDRFVAPGQGRDRSARSAAPRRELDFGSFSARRERGRTRLGLRDADVRRIARPHRSSRRRHAEDAVAAQCACSASRASSSTSSRTR